MPVQLNLPMLPQPNEESCGPTCLHALYGFFGTRISLKRVIQEVPRLPKGGTLASLLGCHALRQGFRPTIFTYNLQLFDPTWFDPETGVPWSPKTDDSAPIISFLQKQRKFKHSARLDRATKAYQEFIQGGGILRLQDLHPGIIRSFLDQKLPVLTGLSGTYLYQSPREYGAAGKEDSIRGHPMGHFVVLTGYDDQARAFEVTDPLRPNPITPEGRYWVSEDRIICSILLGVLTYDANLLILEPA